LSVKQKTVQDYISEDVVMEDFWDNVDALRALDDGHQWQYSRRDVVMARFNPDGSVAQTYAEIMREQGMSSTGHVGRILNQAMGFLKSWLT